MKISSVAALSVTLAIYSAWAQPPASAPEEVSGATTIVPQAVAASNQDKDWQPNAAQREQVLRDVLGLLGRQGRRPIFRRIYTVHPDPEGCRPLC